MKKIILLLIVVGLLYTMVNSRGEEAPMAWVLCQPDSYVNIRTKPRKNASTCGQLYSGDYIFLDGISRNGFLHCINMSTEEGEGWVYKGFIVYSEPYEDGHEYLIDSDGRVACRRSVDGTRRLWLSNEDVLTVYMASDDWCLTDKGFVKTEFINLQCPINYETPDPDMMTWEEE